MQTSQPIAQHRGLRLWVWGCAALTLSSLLPWTFLLEGLGASLALADGPLTALDHVRSGVTLGYAPLVLLSVGSAWQAWTRGRARLAAVVAALPLPGALLCWGSVLAFVLHH